MGKGGFNLIETYLSYKPIELGFGTSGLRGLVEDMTDLECYINVTGFLDFLKSEGRLTDTVYIAGDLRASTPRILQAIATAIIEYGQRVVYCGLIPTPALAYFAQLASAPCIMVTGSHIPDDRNGIKFYKTSGEVLKCDEARIKAHVASSRKSIYETVETNFDSSGALLRPAGLPAVEARARQNYKKRFINLFDQDSLRGKKVVVYQHSAVGRDLMVEVAKDLGAEVVAVGRSEKFIPIDTENVTVDDQAYFRQLAIENQDVFAIISTDGDSDRPFVIDGQGIFHRGDVLGAVVASAIKADFVAYPISTSDAVDQFFAERGVAQKHTRIGSPYVIETMDAAIQSGTKRTVGWEVNGGFLVGQGIEIDGKPLSKLATRDALFPIFMTLVSAARYNKSVAEMFDELPARFTQAGLIDNFPVEVAQKFVERYSSEIDTRNELQKYFSSERGFGEILKVNHLDGIRIYFDSGDIAHIRPSGNAPQLRIYTVADSQDRADEIVQMAIAEPDGIFRSIETDLI